MEALGRLTPKPEYLGDEEQAREFLRYALKFPEFSFDTESTGKDTPWKDQAVFVGLAVGHRRACLPIVLLPVLRPLMEHPTMLKACHAIKGDVRWIANANVGISVTDPLIDTVTASVREHSDRPNHQLKFLISDGLFTPTDDRYMKYPSFSDLYNPKDYLKEMLRLENRDKVTDYCSADAWAHLIVFQELRKRLEALPAFGGRNMWQLFLELEVPLTRVLYDYERTGFPLDVDYLNGVRTPINHDYENLVKEIAMETGTPINPMSNPQVAELLFSKLGYQPIKYTSGGRKGIRAPSVDEKVLKTLIAKGGKNAEVVQKILNCHGLSKVRGTYVDGMIKKVSPYGRLHTTLNQGGTETGRLSSSEPNLQNLPARPEKLGAKYKLRKAFRAPEGWSVIDFDFDQVEMKLMAAMGPDETMLQMINSGKDIHCFTAGRVFKHGTYDEYVAAKKAKQKTEVQEKLMADRYRSKCVAEGTLVPTSVGLVPIETLVSTRKPSSFSPVPNVKAWTEGGKHEISQGFYQGENRPSIILHMHNGVKLEGSPEHRIRVIDKTGELVWRKFGHISRSDYAVFNVRNKSKEITKFVAIPFNCWKHRTVGSEANLPVVRITEDWASLLAYIAGDGWLGEKSFSIAVGSTYKEETKHLKGLLERLGLPYSITNGGKRTVGATMDVLNFRVWSRQVCAFLRTAGAKTSGTRMHVPWAIMRSPWTVIRAFLKIYFECDGCHSKGEVHCTSASESYIRELQQLLLYVGIMSRVCPTWNKQYQKNYYKLVITGPDLKVFLDEIGFLSQRKIHMNVVASRTLGRRIPNQERRASTALDGLHGRGLHIIRNAIRNISSGEWGVTEHMAKKLEEAVGENPISSYWIDLCKFGFSKIDRVEKSKATLFDLSMTEDPSYIAQGVISHNTTGFGIAYGQTPYGLSEQLREPKEVCQKYIEEWLAVFPGIVDHIERSHGDIQRLGYVETILGWRRYLPAGKLEHWDSPDRHDRDGEFKKAMRAGYNAIVQGSAADTMKCALIRVHFDKELRQHGFVPCMTVHDEGLGFAPKEEAEWCLKRCCELATDPLAMFGVELPVKITASGGHGPNWYEAKD